MKKIITYLLLSVSFLLSATWVNAQVASDARCPQINQNLYRGLRDLVPNGDIYRLQSFLSYEGVLNTTPTGYFGAMTEAGLAAWQYRNNIAPAIGVFGPITRARVAARCATTPIIPNPNVCPAITQQYPYCPNGTVVPQRNANGCTIGYICNGVNNGYGTPSVSSFSGPTTLAVGQSGTWSVTASDPQNEQLTYNIRWGDEGTNYTLSAVPVSQYMYSQTSTYTHTYSTPGTYTVIITVRDPGGLQAQSTATVTVTGNGYGYSAIRVTYPNAGGTFSRNQAVNVSWTDTNAYIQAQRYDLYVTQYTTPCTYGYYCTQQAQTRYPIATSVYGTSYNWVIPSGISAGQYVIEVCTSGNTYSCDQSDTPFTIDGTGTVDNVTLFVNPSSGSAPLSTTATVTFGTTQSGQYCTSAYNNYVLDWGDGATDALSSGCYYSSQTVYRTHVYTTANTYTVRVMKNGSTVAQIPVTVSGTSTNAYIQSAYVNQSSVVPGNQLTVNWTTTNPPSNASVGLQLIDTSTNQSVGYIALNQNISGGSYVWTVPAASAMCPADSPYVCGNFYGKTVLVRVVMYTPANACFGYCSLANTPTVITSRDTSTFTIQNSTGYNDAVSLVVDPISGNDKGKNATITVSRTSTSGDTSGTLTYATLDWGDGSTEALTYQGLSSTNLSFSRSHTYTTYGTYTVRVIRNSTTLLQQSVTVTQGTGGTGVIPTMTLTTLDMSGGSNGNRSILAVTSTPVANTLCGVSGTLLLDFGDTTSVSISSPYSGSNTCSYETKTFNHTFVTSGTYTVTIRNNAYPYTVYATRQVIVH